MSRDFEELDYRETPLGELILRRRRLLSLGGMEIYEVKLGDAFLMSSLFHEVEMALAHLGLSELEGAWWDVVVGGLGLGYTAVAALEHREVASLLIVDALLPVIEWHQKGLVPLGKKLTSDPRCAMLHADFFACARSASRIRSQPVGPVVSRGAAGYRSFAAQSAAPEQCHLLSGGRAARALHAFASRRGLRPLV